MERYQLPIQQARSQFAKIVQQAVAYAKELLTIAQSAMILKVIFSLTSLALLPVLMVTQDLMLLKMYV